MICEPCPHGTEPASCVVCSTPIDRLERFTFDLTPLRHRAPHPTILAGAIRFARENWRDDGADGETVHLLAREAERSIDLAAETTTAKSDRDAALQHAADLRVELDEMAFQLATAREEIGRLKAALGKGENRG